MEEPAKPLIASQTVGYKWGDLVSCRIAYAEYGGYHVFLIKDGLPGVLRTSLRFKSGDDVYAQYVGARRCRVLLADWRKKPPGDEQPCMVPTKPLTPEGENHAVLALPIETQ